MGSIDYVEVYLTAFNEKVRHDRRRKIVQRSLKVGHDRSFQKGRTARRRSLNVAVPDVVSLYLAVKVFTPGVSPL